MEEKNEVKKNNVYVICAEIEYDYINKETGEIEDTKYGSQIVGVCTEYEQAEKFLSEYYNQCKGNITEKNSKYKGGNRGKEIREYYKDEQYREVFKMEIKTIELNKIEEAPDEYLIRHLFF